MSINLYNFFDETEDFYYKTLKNLSLINVTYMSFALDVPEKKFVFFSNKDWSNFYIENRIDTFDPVRVAAENFQNKYLRWDTISGTKISKELMMERENICNIHSGFSIISRKNEKTSIFSIAKSRSKNDIYSLILSKIPHLLQINENLISFCHKELKWKI